MGNNGLAIAAQHRLLVERIRTGPQRGAASVGLAPTTPLADRIPTPRPVPTLDVAPTTRRIDRSNRIQLRIRGRGVDVLLGWEPGQLTATSDGPWVVLRPSDGRGGCCYSTDGRIRLDTSTRWRLGVSAGDEVLAVAVPAEGALALSNPALILTHSPLSLLEVSDVA